MTLERAAPGDIYPSYVTAHVVMVTPPAVAAPHQLTSQYYVE